MSTPPRDAEPAGAGRPAGPVLFVAALEEESAALPAGVEVLHLGVGKVQAASALASRLARGDVGLVVNIGTAGALTPRPVGEVLEVAVVHQHDFDQAGVSAFVGRELPGGPIRLSGPPGADARLATGDRIVVAEDERRRLAAAADLVDMEGYAVAAVAQGFGVPVWLAKAVSDSADADAPADWPRALRTCSRTLAAWARRRGLLP